MHFRFSINKLDAEKEFALNLAFLLDVEGLSTDLNILNDTRIPIPVCNTEFTLPGDGTIKGFIRAVGKNAAQSAVDVVLEQLGLKVF